jgi:hypothetical protein
MQIMVIVYSRSDQSFQHRGAKPSFLPFVVKGIPLSHED